jgi:hypothetical protein
MAKKLKGSALAQFEAKRDIWQEVLDGVRQIKSGGGKRHRSAAGWKIGGFAYAGSNPPRPLLRESPQVVSAQNRPDPIPGTAHR